MAKQGKDGILWCDETWNPMRGCSHVSAGCDHCWAARMATRHEANPVTPHLRGFARDGHWTGKVELIESELEKPLHWRKPKRIAVALMGDLFRLRAEDIDRVFAVMALCPQHTFLLLTKQARRMYKYSEDTAFRAEMIGIEAEYRSGLDRYINGKPRWEFPLCNVHLGVSAENQATLDERVPWLLRTPAARRWLSLEPLLGLVDLQRPYLQLLSESGRSTTSDFRLKIGVDLVVVGGESGPGARPMHPDWVLQVRDQCAAASVPFMFKQWGEWAPNCLCLTKKPCPTIDRPKPGLPGCMFRCGKKAAGRLLDGRTWEGETE